MMEWVDSFSSLNIFVEGEEDKTFIEWLLGNDLSDSLNVEECGGKGCQEAIAKKYRVGGVKLIISDRDYGFIYRAYEEGLNTIRNKAEGGSYIWIKERKTDLIKATWSFTELENLWLLIFFSLEEGKKLLRKEEKFIKEKLVAFTLMRALNSLFINTIHKNKESLIEKLKEKILSAKKENEIRKIIEEILNWKIEELPLEKKKNLKDFNCKLNSISARDSFFLYLIAGKEALKFINEEFGGILGKVLKQQGLVPSKKNSDVGSGSPLINNLHEELIHIIKSYYKDL